MISDQISNSSCDSGSFFVNPKIVHFFVAVFVAGNGGFGQWRFWEMADEKKLKIYFRNFPLFFSPDILKMSPNF